MEEQENQEGVLARTWTSQNVRMYRTKHALFKTWWNYVLSIAGFRGALVETSPRAALLQPSRLLPGGLPC